MLSAQYDGPLPPPLMLRQYDETIPGLARKIVDHFDDEQSHRHAWERSVVTAQDSRWRREGAEHRRSQLLAFTLGALAIASSTAVSIVGIVYHSTAGVTVGGAIGVLGVGSLVTAFLAGRRVQQTTQAPQQPTDEK